VGQTVNVTFDEMLFVPDRFRGKVTFRFDDGNDTVFTEAKPRMDAYRYPGVAAVIISSVGQAGKMTLAQLQHLQDARGWDIIGHSAAHEDFVTMTPRQLHDDCIAVRSWLLQNGFIRGSRFESAPYHSWNNSVLDIVEKYFLGFQCIDGEYGVIPPGSPWRMMCFTVDDATPVATIQGWIDFIIETDGWLTILIESIGPPPASITAANFQAVLDYLYNNNVEVVTFSEVFDELIGDFRVEHTQLLFYGVQGVITPNATSYPCPGGGVAAQTANEIQIPISRRGWLKNLRVRQRVASGAAGRTDIYTVRVNGVATNITCTLDNALEGSDLTHSAVVNPGDRVGISLVSNNAADTSADVEVSVEVHHAR
jgi:hypothetical protein